MSDTVLTCSAEGCESTATETLFLRGQVGHVHDCARDAAILREWCDVIHGEPMVDGECLAVVCTGNESVSFGQPTPLGDSS
jgi:hypothetical protein